MNFNSISLLCSFCILLISIWVGGYFQKIYSSFYQDSNTRDLTKEELLAFESIDKNSDGNIDPLEFKEIANIFLKDAAEYPNHINVDSSFDPKHDEVLRLNAQMEPLLLSTMSQAQKTPAFGTPLFEYSSSFSGLLSWKTVNVPEMTIYSKEFKVFLPYNKNHEVNKPYWLITPPESRDEQHSELYEPPTPVNKIEKLVFKILSMFHPRTFVLMRFPPQGGIANIRASNDEYLDINFRFHCEFQLNEPPNLPFWFTPSQFAGNIIISREGEHVRQFNLFVPNKRKLNADMEWENAGREENSMEVDIGFIPLMKIDDMGPSSPLLLYEEDGSFVNRSELWKAGHDIELHFDKIVWKNEVTVTEANNEIEKEFYPFKKVPYLSFEDAFDRAQIENKIVHQVVLWGALDDQSC